MSAKKAAKRAARKRPSRAKPHGPRNPLGPQPDVPPQPIMPGGPPAGVLVSQGGPSEFKDPDFDKPIRDILNLNGAPVEVRIMKGKRVDGADTALVHVQNARSHEWLTQADAKLKFVQDVEGNVYYVGHGFAIPPVNTKPVDVVELAS